MGSDGMPCPAGSGDSSQGSGCVQVSSPRHLTAEEKPSRSSGLVGVGRPGEEGPWSPGVRGACLSKAGDRTSLQSRGLCSRTWGLVGAQSLMTA